MYGQCKQGQLVEQPKSPFDLKQIYIQKVQDLHFAGHYSQENFKLLDDLNNQYLNMQEIKISVNGIIKLLQGLKFDPCIYKTLP